MSMFTPRGEGARPLRRRGSGAEVRATPRPSCPKPSPVASAVAPSRVKVNVYNATDRRGLAARVAGRLERRGFKVAKIDNDPLMRTVTGVAEVRNSTAGVGAARTVAAQVGTVVAVPDKRTDASVDLVLGAAFTGLVTPAEAASALSPSPSPTRSGC